MSYTFTVETSNELQSSIIIEIWNELLDIAPDNVVQYISNDSSDHPYAPNLKYSACITFSYLSLNVLKTIFNIGRYGAMTFGTNCYIDDEIVEGDIEWGEKRNIIVKMIRRFLKADDERYKPFYNKVTKRIDAVR